VFNGPHRAAAARSSPTPSRGVRHERSGLTDFAAATRTGHSIRSHEPNTRPVARRLAFPRPSAKPRAVPPRRPGSQAPERSGPVRRARHRSPRPPALRADGVENRPVRRRTETLPTTPHRAPPGPRSRAASRDAPPPLRRLAAGRQSPVKTVAAT